MASRTGTAATVPHLVRPPRPRVVALACLLLALAAVAQLAALPLRYWHQDFFHTAARSFEPMGGVAFAAFGTTADLAADLLTAVLAVGLLTLAAVNVVGVNGSRIASWASGPILACCGTVGAARSPRPLYTIYSDENLDRITAMARDAMPNWLEPLLLTLGLGVPMAILVALVLLALPSANAFFQPRTLIDPPWPVRTSPAAEPEGPPRAG
ncbi:hypothetical protein NIE79_005355 [Micromonospora sp. NIE79]|uniref:DUF2567 domain-containing protein n=1 Tax=Micromonospora trifolii TaxID=2911208 RepID=A0ABS9N9M1_9ACTN|nr:hypothetical protein [Micromonospora trifolii]MCG5446655.1 hypothetical protein [Micromonospora trifolii]